MNPTNEQSVLVIRSCRNCHHRQGPLFGDVAVCLRSGYSCQITRQQGTLGPCDDRFDGWQPRRQKRSLRQWLIDLVWRAQ